ncbi:hypothetical protein ACX3O0_01545 [Homoserinimonas sp. A447]
MPADAPALRPALRFSGIWSRIPVTDDAATAKAVRALVRDLVGSDDARATERERLRRELLDSVGEARRLGATEVYLAEQVADGIPVSAMLSVHGATPRLSVAIGTNASAVMDAFVDGLRRSGNEPSVAERFAVGESQVLRTTETVETKQGQSLAVRFWVTVPSTKTVLPLTFATPFEQLAEPLVALFTAIVSTLQWLPAESSNRDHCDSMAPLWPGGGYASEHE